MVGHHFFTRTNIYVPFQFKIWSSYKNIVGVGGMGVLLNITMAKSFFGGKYLINTKYRHKKPFSLILMVSRGKNWLTPKIGPKKWLIFFLSEYTCVIYHWNQKIMLLSKMNVTLTLFFIFSCYFIKPMGIKMKKFRIFIKKFGQKLSVCPSYKTILSKQREGLLFIKTFREKPQNNFICYKKWTRGRW